MVIIVYVRQREASIRTNLGRPEYSYYFVYRAYLPLLRKLGRVVVLERLDEQIDAIYDFCKAWGEPCVFLSFTPPHRAPVEYRCPTLTAFAWEYPDIPTETWDEDPRNDWRYVLGKHGAAVTHCSSAVDATRRAMGSDFPVISVPAPLWDGFHESRSQKRGGGSSRDCVITVTGRPVHIKGMGAQRSPGPPVAHSAEASFELDLDAGGWHSDPLDQTRLPLQGVIYTTLLNPNDGRKNWQDIVKAFAYAFRHTADAILVVKLISSQAQLFRQRFLDLLHRLAPFDCQYVVIDSYLDDREYAELAAHTAYIVNASTGEGQCLPLMEYMSCGTPAVAPRHTAMVDYLDHSNAFLVDTGQEPAIWPHDPRRAWRTTRHRIDVGSLIAAFADSYAVARDQPDRYRAMSEAAVRRLRAFCSEDAVADRLAELLKRHAD